MLPISETMEFFEVSALYIFANQQSIGVFELSSFLNNFLVSFLNFHVSCMSSRVRLFFNKYYRIMKTEKIK